MPKEARDIAIIVGIFIVLGAITFFASAALPAQDIGVATTTARSTVPSSKTPDPQSTAFSTVDLTVEEQSYLNEVAYQSQSLSDSFDRFSELTNSSNVNIDDPRLVAAVGAELDVWHQIYADAKTLTPPSRFVTLHTKYLAALEQYDLAATDIVAGVKSQDNALMQRADAELQQGNELIQQASDELEKALESGMFSLQILGGPQKKPMMR